MYVFGGQETKKKHSAFLAIQALEHDESGKVSSFNDAEIDVLYGYHETHVYPLMSDPDNFGKL